ncbi:hypothetical protein RZS28_05335 [Methylocapsa polymorpha]|uniref:Uncharacterized protein n=1 Tax=Methylocapsa polymorpha TaxID=3080828 RepID=A0ABZ0HTU6_9HYPH|nr:hypothetical protein RZS28_05335 [Methylocapsa sp. RX1]
MKKILIAAAAAAAIHAAPAVAEDQALVCWYNDDGAFASASGAPATAKMGAVERTGDSGGTAYSYVISARDGGACPYQVPLGTKSAKTVPLVRQDESNCTNDDVSSADAAVLGGSVTVFRASSQLTGVSVHLTGAAPNATFRVKLKCDHQLGTVKTDAKGDGNATFDFVSNSVGPSYAFDISPELASAGNGNTFQSVKITR